MPRLTPEQIKSIPELYNSGLSTRNIATKLKCTHQAILQHLKKNNIEMRPPHFNGRWPDSPSWNGWYSRPFVLRLRKRKEIVLWREQILQRDSYMCTECQSTEELEVDHIKPISLIIKEYNITEDSLFAVIDIPELIDTNNGRTLCKSCHKKTKSYWRKS